MKSIILCLMLSVGFILEAKEGKPPSCLYLTWIHDPSTTMTIQWHTIRKDSSTAISYRKLDTDEWLCQEGLTTPLRKTNIYVSTVELGELEADQEYEFQIVGRKGSYRFRTLPAQLDRPLRFVVGGDAYFYLSTFQKMNEKIAAADPDFVIIGGDIAYTNGRKTYFKMQGWELRRWRTFFKEWKSTMVTSDGRLIPLLPVIGNHDIRAVTLKSKPYQFLFYELFALPEAQKSYRVFDVGDYLSVFLLDTGHTFQISGQQTEWLKTALAERENIAYTMAAYHVGGFPSVYSFRGRVPKEIRKAWVPLFERYHLNVAFEHHNHAYKRTFPIKGNKINPNGVVYLGDGSWGVSPRKPKEMWYLEKSAKANTVNIVTLSAEGGAIEVLGIEGEPIDTLTLFPHQQLITWNSFSLLEE